MLKFFFLPFSLSLLHTSPSPSPPFHHHPFIAVLKSKQPRNKIIQLIALRYPLYGSSAVAFQIVYFFYLFFSSIHIYAFVYHSLFRPFKLYFCNRRVSFEHRYTFQKKKRRLKILISCIFFFAVHQQNLYIFMIFFFFLI